jgi:hypothetical protein
VGHADDAVHRRADLVAHHGEKVALGALGRLRFQGELALVRAGCKQLPLGVDAPTHFASRPQVAEDEKPRHQGPACDQQPGDVAGFHVRGCRAGGEQARLLVREGLEIVKIATGQDETLAACVDLQRPLCVLPAQRDGPSRRGQGSVPIDRDPGDSGRLRRVVANQAGEALRVPGNERHRRPENIESRILAGDEKGARAALGVGNIVPQRLR